MGRADVDAEGAPVVWAVSSVDREYLWGKDDHVNSPVEKRLFFILSSREDLTFQRDWKDESVSPIMDVLFVPKDFLQGGLCLLS